MHDHALSELPDSRHDGNERALDTERDEDFAKPLGFENRLDAILPEAVTPADLVDINSSKTTKGDGTVVRDEVIALAVAAIVTQVLPNGNPVIRGRREVRVNFEVREM